MWGGSNFVLYVICLKKLGCFALCACARSVERQSPPSKRLRTMVSIVAFQATSPVSNTGERIPFAPVFGGTEGVANIDSAAADTDRGQRTVRVHPDSSDTRSSGLQPARLGAAPPTPPLPGPPRGAAVVLGLVRHRALLPARSPRSSASRRR